MDRPAGRVTDGLSGALVSLAVVITATTMLVAGTAPPAGAQGASPSDASRFVRLINGERTSRGLPALSSHGELAGIAAAHSRRMAASVNDDGACNDTGGLRHRSSVSRGVDAPWTALAENVGYLCPADVGDLHQRLMDSASHRTNILDGRMRHVGVGAHRDADGGLWVTQIFMATGAQSSPDAGPGSSPPAPEPDPWDAVGTYQQLLRDLDYYDGPIDGLDGPRTSEAVRNFQRANDLTVDGIVGPATWKRLNADDAVDATTWRRRTRSTASAAPPPGATAGDGAGPALSGAPAPLARLLRRLLADTPLEDGLLSVLRGLAG